MRVEIKFTLLLLLTINLLSAHDTLLLKRNNLLVKFSNAGLVRMRSSYHYTVRPENARGAIYDLILNEYTTIFNPKIDIGYQYNFNKHNNPKHNNYQWWSVFTELNFKELNCNFQYQSAIAPSSQNTIYSTNDRFRLFGLSCGVKFNWKFNHNKIVALSVSVSRSHWHSQMMNIQVSDNNGSIIFTGQQLIKNSTILDNTNAYSSVESKFFVGKKIGRKNLGFFLEHCISDYTLQNKYFVLHYTSFLKDYHCFYLGAYLNL